jgi:hypothetical protein
MSTNVQDAAVSMLPDLSENLSNEERTWEEIMQIKAMPVCMAQKIQLKNQLQVMATLNTIFFLFKVYSNLLIAKINNS